jgi:hypothetical protein
MDLGLELRQGGGFALRARILPEPGVERIEEMCMRLAQLTGASKGAARRTSVAVSICPSVLEAVQTALSEGRSWLSPRVNSLKRLSTSRNSRAQRPEVSRMSLSAPCSSLAARLDLGFERHEIGSRFGNDLRARRGELAT